MGFIVGTSKRDRLIGTVGQDTIQGLDGNDVIDGREGVNCLESGNGADTLRAGLGRDSLDAGPGNDLVLIKSSELGTTLFGHLGKDTVRISNGSDNGLLDLGYSARSALHGDLFSKIEVEIGNHQAKIKKFGLFGEKPDVDRIEGLSHLGPDGALRVSGTANAELFQIDRRTGPDVKIYVSGNDTVEGSGGTYESVHIPGFNGSDFGAEVRITSNTNGQMTGTLTYSERGVDSTVVFSGIDIIDGSPGTETVIGSSGADTYRPSFGNDGFDGKRGFDTVVYDFVTIDTSYVDLAAGFAVSRYTNFGGRSTDGLRGVEGVIGSDRAFDDFRGNKAGNLLDGAGNDDRLSGRNGRDTLIGGDDDDKLMGGNGRDTFRFDLDDGSDRIPDFEDGRDKIEILGGIGFADVEIVDLGRHTVVTFEATTVTLLKIEHTLIGAEDFAFV